MIRQLILGLARLLWGFSILVFAFGLGLAYLSYRTIRFAIRGDKPYPVRDASFGVMASVALLAKALKDQSDAKAGRATFGERRASEAAADIDIEEARTNDDYV